MLTIHSNSGFHSHTAEIWWLVFNFNSFQDRYTINTNLVVRGDVPDGNRVVVNVFVYGQI